MHSFLERLAPIWRPHPGQLDFLTHDAKFKVLACGRRWGKTDACAAQIVASLFEDSPTRHVVIAPTADQAAILFDRAVELLKALLGPRKWKSKVAVRRTPYPRFTFQGHRVVARSGHVGRSLRGNEATHIVIDEAAYVPEDLVTEVAMPMLATTDGRMTLISTPRGTNHFYRFFQMGQRGEHGVWSRKAPSSESPLVSAGFLEVQRELISERAFRVEYLADFLDPACRVFKSEAIDRCIVRRLSEPIEEPFAIGVDWARYTDFTAVAVVSGNRNHARLVHLERFNQMPWRDQVRRVADIAGRFSRARVFCDATAGGDVLFEYLREALSGATAQGVVFNSSLKAGLIDRLVSLVEDGALEMTAHPELIREMEHFEARETDFGNRRMGAMQGYHDDLVIALALACKELKRESKRVERVGPVRSFPVRFAKKGQKPARRRVFRKDG